MKAGRLWRRVSFERPNPTRDDYGQTDRRFMPAFRTRGDLRMQTGREVLEAGRLESSTLGTLSVRECRRARDVEAGWRAVIDGQPWQIRTVQDGFGRNEEITFVVERGVAQ